MALEFDWNIKAVNANCGDVTFEDVTTYSGANEDRHNLANKYLAYKQDEDGIGTAVDILSEPDPVNDTGEVDPTDYVPDLIQITSSVDGVYMLLLLSCPLWDSGDNYVSGTDLTASITYYETTQKFYKALQNNNNVAPDSGSGPANWEEITDFEAIIDNSTITTVRYQDIVACRLEKALLKELEANADDLICDTCNPDNVDKSTTLDLLLNAAYAANNLDKYDKAEKYLRKAEELIS